MKLLIIAPNLDTHIITSKIQDKHLNVTLVTKNNIPVTFATRSNNLDEGIINIQLTFANPSTLSISTVRTSNFIVTV